MSYTEQLILEETFSKKNTLKLLKETITSEYFIRIRKQLIFCINKYLHKEYWESKADYITAICMLPISISDIADEIMLLTLKHQRTTIQNAANDLGNIFDIDDEFIKVQIGADLLNECSDIIYKLTRERNSIMFTSTIVLDKYARNKMSLFMYVPPMICEPMKISNNFQSGYLTWNESLILGNRHSDHNKPVRLDIINILNKTKFVLDSEVIKEKEKPKKELKGQDLDNWKQYLKEKRALMKMYKYTPFNLTHAYDSRGRVYSKGYHINYQSSEYNKALISLAKKEICKE